MKRSEVRKKNKCIAFYFDDWLVDDAEIFVMKETYKVYNLDLSI